MNRFPFLCVIVFASPTVAFIPHPAIRFGGQAGESITHTDMVQLGFIRSLAQFFLDTKIEDKSQIVIENLKLEHTIDELYQIANPQWTSDQVKLNTYPLKSVIDLIQVRDALVDLDPATKDLPSAHFDSESFAESNRRIMDLREKVIEVAKNPNSDLKWARSQLGALLHTLQDFYSHSNWIEMGKTEINHRIGIEENIGKTATSNQATCTSDGCTKTISKCNLLQRFVLKTCPMVYYDCKNNILPEINQQGILTSGYMSNQFNDENKPVTKPDNVQKCSHGSIMDKTAHQEPAGGINKDTMTPVYSPHYHLHFQAARAAIDATERFFNDLRNDLGDAHFDRLFSINPTPEQLDKAAIAMKTKQKFHFLTSTLSIGLSSRDINFDRTLKQRIQQILSVLFGIVDPNAPSYDLSDFGVKKADVNVHAGSLLIDVAKAINRRRFVGH